MDIKTLENLAALLHIKTSLNLPFTQINVDSRCTMPGELFWALKGERVDGHLFLEQAFARGAIAAVVDKSYTGPNYGKPLLVVDDTLHALQDCAKIILASRKTRIVGVTGSLGKTTVKEMVRTLLSTKYCVSANPGNSNSQIGLPLTILNHTTGGEDILVLEMAMTAPGQITRLTHLAPPEVAVVTNISLVHACFFESINEIAMAKAEIFSQPKTRLGILPYEAPNYSHIFQQGDCYKLSISTFSSAADYFLDENNIIHASKEIKSVAIDALTLPAKHNRHNFLTAVAVARHFDVSWEEIIQAIPYLKLPDKRLQFVEHKGIHFLNDSYNAAENSVKGALEALPSPKVGGKKVAVLGSMMELGKFSQDCHTRVGEHALNYVDSVYCLGEECQPIYEIFQQAGKESAIFSDRDQLVRHLRTILKPSDVVLLKGSCSKELWKVLDEL